MHSIVTFLKGREENESHHSAGLQESLPVGRQLRGTQDPGLQAGAEEAVRAGPAHRLLAHRHVQRAGRHEQGRQGVVQERHHLQHGRVRRPAAGPSGELPFVHVEAPVRPDRHPQGERQYPQRQRPRPRRRVQRLRGPDPQGRRHSPVRRRDRTRWAHRVQRAGLLADLPHPHGDADHGHEDRQLAASSTTTPTRSPRRP